MAKFAISYIRFSTPEQLKGDSLRRQLAKSQDWCQRNGYTLDSKTYRDLGISAFTGDNLAVGKLGAFMRAVEAGQIKPGTVLIVESLDRLTRQQVPDALEFFLGILRLGIIIVTLTPEDRFERKTLNEIQLIIVIVILSRAYNESSTKSERVADAWKKKKLDARTGHKLTKACPGWLVLKSNEFDFVLQKRMAVLRLIELANTGIGIGQIAKIMNREKQPTLKDNAKYWHESSVYKTITNRALFGEYQPKFSNKNQTESDRKPDGQPIPNYYKPLISETEFYALQAGMQSRKVANKFGTGRKSLKVTNLFGKLMKHVRTGSTICRMDKGKKSVPFLISSEAKVGAAIRETFPYEDWESHFLAWLKEVSFDELADPKKASKQKTELKAVQAKIVELTAKLKKLKTSLLEDAQIDTLLDVVKELDHRLTKLRQEEQLLKMETAKPDNLSAFKTVESLMKTVTGEELSQLRAKLRDILAEAIQVIFVSFEINKTERRMYAQIHFRNNTVRRMTVLSYLQYAGGGSSNPVPVRVSTSMSSAPMELFGAIPEEWFVVGNRPVPL